MVWKIEVEDRIWERDLGMLRMVDIKQSESVAWSMVGIYICRFHQSMCYLRVSGVQKIMSITSRRQSVMVFRGVAPQCYMPVRQCLRLPKDERMVVCVMKEASFAVRGVSFRSVKI